MMHGSALAACNAASTLGRVVEGVPRKLFGMACYSYFLYALTYLVVFMNNIGYYVPAVKKWFPRELDGLSERADAGDMSQAALVNAGLLAVFAITHSTLARPAVKRFCRNNLGIPFLYER